MKINKPINKGRERRFIEDILNISNLVQKTSIKGLGNHIILNKENYDKLPNFLKQ
jgi:hypothetical protein